jgi:hypothetical protein
MNTDATMPSGRLPPPRQCDTRRSPDWSPHWPNRQSFAALISGPLPHPGEAGFAVSGVEPFWPVSVRIRVHPWLQFLFLPTPDFASGLTAPSAGHVEDGNFHTVIMLPPEPDGMVLATAGVKDCPQPASARAGCG